MKNTIAKKTEGYGYKYTELADINKYCEENEIKYYQEIETNELNVKDYIITYTKEKEDTSYTKHRGCQIVQAVLSGIKNPVQEYGSSLTYCRRYSLLMALGLATEDDDASSLTEEVEPTLEEAQEYVLDFGKHNGKKLTEIPKNYLEWLRDSEKTNGYIKKCINLLYPLPSEEDQKEILKLIPELNDLLEQTNTDRDKFYSYYKVTTDGEMTLEQLKDGIEKLKQKLE